MRNKRICFFLHYFPDPKIPLYVQYYLKELSHYFEEIRLITNNRTLLNIPENLLSEVKIQFVTNEGYDFGMFYKGLKGINPDDYNQIACINDSNLLLSRLESFFENEKVNNADFWGLIDSNESPWFSNHENSYHIQSHFLVFNKPSISALNEYMKRVDIKELFEEKNQKKLRRKIIHEWEIGVSQYLIRNGMKGTSIFNSSRLLEKYNVKGQNATHSLYEELLAEGYPLLKKKIVTAKRLKLISTKPKIKKLITRYGNTEWDLIEALNEIV